MYKCIYDVFVQVLMYACKFFIYFLFFFVSCFRNWFLIIWCLLLVGTDVDFSRFIGPSWKPGGRQWSLACWIASCYQRWPWRCHCGNGGEYGFWHLCYCAQSFHIAVEATGLFWDGYLLIVLLNVPLKFVEILAWIDYAIHICKFSLFVSFRNLIEHD